MNYKMKPATWSTTGMNQTRNALEHIIPLKATQKCTFHPPWRCPKQQRALKIHVAQSHPPGNTTTHSSNEVYLLLAPNAD
jgi:hypothetical protein